MKPRDFYLLLSLAGEDKHGADIFREVLSLSDRRLHLWPARLYGALDSLVKRELIEDLSGSGRHPEGKSERRRYYRISPIGLEALRAETARLAGLVDLSRLRTGLADEPTE